MSQNAKKPQTPGWEGVKHYPLPSDVLPVFIRYPDGKRIVGHPGSWHWLATGGAA